MTAYQLLSSLPPLTLDAGCTISIEAIEPDTGGTVTGVTVGNVLIYLSNARPTELPGESDVLFAVEAE